MSLITVQVSSPSGFGHYRYRGTVQVDTLVFPRHEYTTELQSAMRRGQIYDVKKLAIQSLV